MLFFNVTNLDYYAVKLQGMAIILHDDGNTAAAKELDNIAMNLKEMSNEIKDKCSKREPEDIQL